MLITLNLNFLGRLFAWRPLRNWRLSSTARKRTRSRSGLRLGTEGLEDRCLLTDFVVTTAADVVDPDDEFLSLREAVTAANLNFGADTIHFSGALFGQTIQVTEGQLFISGSVTITGLGALNTVISAQNNSRVFNVGATGGDVTFQSLTITGGRTTDQDAFGAGIRYQASGTLTLIDVEVRGNTTTGLGARGGGIATNEGDVLLIRSTVAENTTTGANAVGGGIAALDGDITLINSTVSGNTTTNNDAGGGGISTLLGNINLTNSTVAFNRTTGGASSPGGGIYSAGVGGILTLNNSIVALNTSVSTTTQDISISTGTLANSSLIGVNAGSGLDPSPPDTRDINGNFIGTIAEPFDPRLRTLTLNGGQTRTHRLGNSSLAINAGNNFLAVDQNGNPLPSDQAGQQRIFAGIVDMGAYEVQEVITRPLVSFELAAQSVTEGAGLFTLTVIMSQPTDADVIVQFVASGTATRDFDYAISAIAPIIIPAGETSVRIDVTILDDIVDEPNEFVTFELRRATNATVGDPFTDVLTILDNDGAEAGGPTNINLSSNVVNENVTDTEIGTLTTIDPNIGDTATFTILPGGQGDLFEISNNKLLVGDTAFDFESLIDGIALVNVRATDSTGLSFIKQLRVSVGDLNETPEMPENQTFSIPEGTVKDVLVGTVTSTDPDSGAPNNIRRYDITGGNIGNAFRISAASGEIRVLNPLALNAETNPIINLVVQVTDSGDPSLSTAQLVTIFVTDINEAPVIPPNQTLFVNEESGDGTTVGTVIARDTDVNPSNSTLTYSIIGGNTNGAFAINPATGRVTVANSSQLTFANGATYSLLVRVDDFGSPSLSDVETLTIRLVDVNQPPTIPGGQSFSLNENPSNGQILGSVAASDPDPTSPNNRLTFLIVGGNTGAAFAINSSTGLLTVNNPTAVNFETTPQFNLQIKVSDGGNPSRSAIGTVLVTLNDISDAPVIGDNQQFTVSEDANVGTVVGTVLGSDPDGVSPGDQAFFSITGGNSGNAFAIDPITGQLTVTSTSLDHETTPTYNLSITLTDDLGASTTANVTVHVSDTNEAPILGNIGSAPVYSRGQTKKVVVLPFITVNDADSPTDLAEVRISLPIPAGVKNPDRLLLKGVRKLGRVSETTANGRREITITLKSGVTSSEVEAFLRKITFSTKGTGLSLNHRDIQVQVFDRQGAASNIVTQDVAVGP